MPTRASWGRNEDSAAQRRFENGQVEGAVRLRLRKPVIPMELSLVLFMMLWIAVFALTVLDCCQMSFGKFGRLASDFVLKPVPILDDAIPRH
jgi:hypothetical protein